MSETTENLNRDDRAILLALARVIASGTGVPLPASASRPQDEARVREYLETLGLLAYELEPAVPEPQLRARILAQAGGRDVDPSTERSFDEVTFAEASGAGSVDVTLQQATGFASPEADRPFDEVTLAGLGTGTDAAGASVTVSPVEQSSPGRPEARPFEVGVQDTASWEFAGAIADATVTGSEDLMSDHETVTRETPSEASHPIAPPEPVAPAAAIVEPVAPIAAEPPVEPPAPVFEMEPVAPPVAEPPVAPPVAMEPVAPPASLPEPTPLATVTESPAPASRWPYALLAAMLALCMLGVGYLAGKVNEQNSTIARLNSRLQALPVQDLGVLSDELSTMKRRFHMVTTVARKAYRMRAVETSGRSLEPSGVVYVCGVHQRWYLNIQSLEPPPSGQAYNLWFLTEEGMINGGTVEVTADASSEMDKPSMPVGTNGFAVTLERAGDAAQSPQGAMVLLAEDSVTL